MSGIFSSRPLWDDFISERGVFYGICRFTRKTQSLKETFSFENHITRTQNTSGDTV